MKSIIGILGAIVLGIGTQAQGQIRHGIGEDIPLQEAVRRANEEMKFVPKLTEIEVLAAVRALKITHPDIDDSIYKVYQRILKERVLPRGMYFDQIRQWGCDGGHYEVDWKDLIYWDEKNRIGFSYRLRERFVSFRPTSTCSSPNPVEQSGADQPATAPQSNPEEKVKTKPESEGRPQ